MLHLGQNREVVRVDGHISAILEGRQEVQCLLEAVKDALGWLSRDHGLRKVGVHTGRLRVEAADVGGADR